MENAKSINWQKIVSLSLVVIGTLGLFIGNKYPSSCAVLLLPHGLSLSIIPLGLSWYAQTKGRSIGWGLFGLIFYIGPLIALIIMGLGDKPPVTTPRSRISILMPLPLMVIGVFIFLASIAVPQKGKYIKRSHTSNAMDQARSICSKIVDWSSLVEAGSGNSDLLQATQNGLWFRDRYPEEAAWLENGNHEYGFIVHVDGTHGSSADNPAVVATNKKSHVETEVYGEIVQVGGKGLITGEDLSGCKSNVEKVSDRYGSH